VGVRVHFRTPDPSPRHALSTEEDFTQPEAREPILYKNGGKWQFTGFGEFSQLVDVFTKDGEKIATWNAAIVDGVELV
jgi:hypothetical protein